MQNKREDSSICSKKDEYCMYNNLPHIHVMTSDGEYIKFKVQKPKLIDIKDYEV
jgi:hypothetical protein